MLRRILRSVAREPRSEHHRLRHAAGFLPLRDQVARRLQERDIAADPNAILPHRFRHALDRPGLRASCCSPATRCVDDPCYFNFQYLMQAQRVRMIGVPYTRNGPDLERFAAACAEHRPKLYLTTAVLHNRPA